MAISKTCFVLYMTLIYVNFIVVFTSIEVSGQCQGDFTGLIQQCSKYVQKSGPEVDPSPECCSVVKNVDFPCVCKHITSEVEQIISMEKAVYVAAKCGKPIPHGTKCGSYTVPS